ncbi:MAG: hypothetical protein C0424_09745 [Sphingobacteriaceae bacterium]|nr:hypothetical protein [Sphingobacteriaceae bacterium]
MKKIAHLMVAGCFLAALFLPIFTWKFVEAQEATLQYTLKHLTYAHSPGNVVSQMDNMALYWLSLGLAILQITLAFSNFSLLVVQKLFNASALLSSALVFSIAVTAYRAEKTILMEVAQRLPEAASWLIIMGWAGSLILFFKHRKAA